MSALPMQPVYVDDDGAARFQANAIVRFLLEEGPYDMNSLALRYFSVEDRVQFAQLIGYSITGFIELSYVSDEVAGDVYAAWDSMTGGGDVD